jgi:GDP/UDP-N,N'-diacetylbacillosamine 2-epimerase (hydrolysing)
MSIKKVLAFTGIRSDYDLMSGLYSKMLEDPQIELGLIVCGAHLSETYGYTVQYIEKDNIPIIAKVESLLDSNSPASRIKSASILMQSCIHTVEAFNPDVIIYAGDREEVIVGALLGAYMGIPTAHFFGGDHATDGNVDNTVRHACSKLSSIHFVTHENHKQRLIKIGEMENRIYVIGNPALDKYINTEKIDKKTILNRLGRENWDEYAVLIFHPTLGFETKSGLYFEQILTALRNNGINTFVSYPNSDAGNKNIIEIINKYAKDDNFSFYKNLERNVFINLMRNANFLIGNSSAGLIEAPSIPLAAINVGIRQRDRLATSNVIFVDQNIEAIMEAIQTVNDKGFRNKLHKIKNPYGDGKSVSRALDLLKRIEFNKYQFKWEDPL